MKERTVPTRLRRGHAMEESPCAFCGAFSQEMCATGCMTSEVIHTIEFGERPWTTNAERAGNRWDRARDTKRWRESFAWLARKQHIPKYKWAIVAVQPYQVGGRLQDVGACNPAVKAAIDGLVDAGVLPDDSPEYLRGIYFLRPQRGKNSLKIFIRGVLA
jgi:hypothetical protein